MERNDILIELWKRSDEAIRSVQHRTFFLTAISVGAFIWSNKARKEVKSLRSEMKELKQEKGE